jgi:RNA polymerase sigma factor (sigma-70 family)
MVVNPITQMIRRLAEDHRVRHLTDQELLDRFSSDHDEAAFNGLVRRHGPMVLDVCRNVLANEADAEDAFQATFLILAQKAGAIRKQASVGSWLYGVAYRTALKAQADSVRRRKGEACARDPGQPETSADLTWREVTQVIQAELNRFNEDYRAPLVLCYLEGRTQDQAAALLGVSKATVRKRLDRGRALLRVRLARRGLGPVAVLMAASWPVAAASVHLRPILVSSTIKAAKLCAAGQAAAAGVVSAKVAALTREVLRTMFFTKLKIAAAALVVASLFVSAALISGLNGPQESALAAQPVAQNKDKPPTEGAPAAEQEGVKVVKPGADYVRSLAYCNDGKSVALVLWKEDDPRAPGSVVLWDVQKGKVAHTLHKFDNDSPGQFFDVTSSKDGTTIAVSTDKHRKVEYGAIEVWDAKTGKLVRTFELDAQVRGFALSADGKKLVGGVCLDFPAKGKMFVWDVKTGEVLQALESEGMWYYSAAVSDDGKWIAGAGYVQEGNGIDQKAVRKGKVVVWEVDTEKVKHEWSDLAIKGVVVFSPDGKQVASAPNGKVIHIWDMVTGKLKHQLKPEGDHEINKGLVFSPDGKTVASCGLKDSRVSLWDLAKKNARITLEGHNGNVLGVAFSPDGRALASGGDDGTMRFWPVASAQPK